MVFLNIIQDIRGNLFALYSTFDLAMNEIEVCIPI